MVIILQIFLFPPFSRTPPLGKRRLRLLLVTSSTFSEFASTPPSMHLRSWTLLWIAIAAVLSESALLSFAMASQEQSGSVPQLPSVPDGAEGVQELKMGDKVKLDAFASTYGPAIVAEDGTLRRIDNWAEMSPREQEVAWRRLVKRNEERKAKLKAAQGAGEVAAAAAAAEEEEEKGDVQGEVEEL
eukprot:scaffold846_cov252-Pinguiococcus_pyrenoidosus.AAC.17